MSWSRKPRRGSIVSPVTSRVDTQTERERERKREMDNILPSLESVLREIDWGILANDIEIFYGNF